MDITNSARGILIKNRKILFIKYNINGKEIFMLPGGSQEKEENAKNCVIREFLEETSFSINVNNLVFVNEFISLQPNSISEKWKGGVHKIELIFSVSILDTVSNKIKEENVDLGAIGLVWLDEKQINERNVYPEIEPSKFFLDSINPFYIFKRY